MPTVLLTGFEPFGGDRVNPSWQAVSELASQARPASRTDNTDDVTIVAVRLPCVFGTAIETLREAVAEHQPELVICVGQAGGRASITPERVAVNLVDARIPDNVGDQPVDEPVVPDGPVAYFTGLPVKAAVSRLRQAGIPASVSHTAGTFVCNQVFYGLMHLIATEWPAVRGGFVHVPLAPEQVASSPSRTDPSMPVATTATGLGLLVRACVETERDILVSAGTLN